jgi:outer membrane protein OmpA-like peptidoglycan-associated protein
LLATQKDSILNALPSGLNLAGALGLGSIGDIGSKLTGAIGNMAGSARDTANKAAGSNKWLMPLVLALIVIAALIYLAKSCNNKVENTATVQPEEVKPDSMPSTQPVAALASIKVKLPDGVELDAYKGGIEDKLVTFLNDPASKGGKDVWFDFDNLNFETGSASLTAESMKQVNNIAAILKAYPKLKVKVGGYTDKSGDAAVNKKLSQSRADAVLTALKGTGANISQLAGAEGYGAEFAKAAADAPDEERKLDRRISLGVREK